MPPRDQGFTQAARRLTRIGNEEPTRGLGLRVSVFLSVCLEVRATVLLP